MGSGATASTPPSAPQTSPVTERVDNVAELKLAFEG